MSEDQFKKLIKAYLPAKAIFEKLDFDTLKKCTQVCTQWQDFLLGEKFYLSSLITKVDKSINSALSIMADFEEATAFYPIFRSPPTHLGVRGHNLTLITITYMKTKSITFKNQNK